ncbi:MAG: GFA family protein [Alphaproteobacteria bacterium]|nr:GFA family protein [Alphaproteobacteria bacterium]
MSHHHGSCLCGGISFEVTGKLREVVACHCTKCRKTSGHFVAATACDDDDLKFNKLDTLAWYQSSEVAERGFCTRCGSTMFFRPRVGQVTGILAGTLDGATGLKLSRHIHCSSKGDYYEINDGLEQSPEG